MSLVKEVKKLPWNTSTAITLLGFLFWPLVLKTVGKMDFYLWATLSVLVDLLDGGIAMILDEENYARRLLDTIRDKLIFFSTLFYLFYYDYIPGYAFWWVVAYFSILVVGGYLSHVYVNYLPISDHIGRISLISLLVLIGYYYTTSPNNPSSLFEFNYQLNIIIILITLILNIACVINYTLKILTKKTTLLLKRVFLLHEDYFFL